MSEKSGARVVWSEIPVTDMAKSMAFYGKVLGADLTLDETGPNPMAILPFDGVSTSGHLYPGKPAAKGTGPTIHVAIPGTAEEAIAAVRAAGGEADDFVVAIPDGRFAYATDPDGNSIGLFEVPKG